MAATNRSLTRQMEEELTCAVCCELYTCPLLLKCRHTFCKKCIQDLVHNDEMGSRYGVRSSSFRCPVCRMTINLKTMGGIGDLPENLAVTNLVNMLKSNEQTGTLFTRRQIPILDVPKCKTHIQSLASIYCLDCFESFCPSCDICKGHKLMAVEKVWKDTWKRIISLMNNAGEKMSSISDRVSLLDDQLKAAQDQENFSKKDLAAEIEILKSMLLLRLSQLKSEVHAEVQGLCHPVVKEKEMCTELLVNLESTNTHIQGLQNSNDGIKSVKTLVQLEETLTGLMQENVPKLLSRSIPVVTMPTWKLLRDSTETSIRTMLVRRTGPFLSQSVVRVGASQSETPMRTSPDQQSPWTDNLASDVNMTAAPSLSNQASSGLPIGRSSSGTQLQTVASSSTQSTRTTSPPGRQIRTAVRMSQRSSLVNGPTGSRPTAGQDSKDKNVFVTFRTTVNKGFDSILSSLKNIEVSTEDWDNHTKKKVKVKTIAAASGFKDFGTKVPESFQFAGSSETSSSKPPANFVFGATLPTSVQQKNVTSPSSLTVFGGFGSNTSNFNMTGMGGNSSSRRLTKPVHGKSTRNGSKNPQSNVNIFSSGANNVFGFGTTTEQSKVPFNQASLQGDQRENENNPFSGSFESSYKSLGCKPFSVNQEEIRKEEPEAKGQSQAASLKPFDLPAGDINPWVFPPAFESKTERDTSKLSEVHFGSLQNSNKELHTRSLSLSSPLGSFLARRYEDQDNSKEKSTCIKTAEDISEEQNDMDQGVRNVTDSDPQCSTVQNESVARFPEGELKDVDSEMYGRPGDTISEVQRIDSHFQSYLSAAPSVTNCSGGTNNTKQNKEGTTAEGTSENSVSASFNISSSASSDLASEQKENIFKFGNQEVIDPVNFSFSPFSSSRLFDSTSVTNTQISPATTSNPQTDSTPHSKISFGFPPPAAINGIKSDLNGSDQSSG